MVTLDAHACQQMAIATVCKGSGKTIRSISSAFLQAFRPRLGLTVAAAACMLGSFQRTSGPVQHHTVQVENMVLTCN